jgi:uncharacterized protein (DUF885 family)
MATHAVAGSPDGKRPGRVVVQTSNATERSLAQDEATAYHEGIPGHLFQRAVAMAQPGLPKFRVAYSNAAYGEGWALYVEQLGKEVGFYQDPVSEYGRLSSELFRAARLVVDTGLHSKGWTRDDAPRSSTRRPSEARRRLTGILTIRGRRWLTRWGN